MIYDERHIKSIVNAERYFAITIAGMLTGAVKSAWSVLYFLSSQNNLMVISGITNSTIKNILWNTEYILDVPALRH